MAEAATRNSRMNDLLARAMLASGIGYVAAAYSISRWLTRSTTGKVTTTPGDLGLPWKPIACRTSDQIQLAGWLVEPPQPRATIALFHGMRGSRAKLLPRIAFLYEHGYRCVAFDHRAHGESSGRRTSFGFHESRDVAAILAYIQDHWPDERRAALGISMGAAAICYAARMARGWDAVILESCYQDIARAFSSRLRQGFPPWYQRLSRGVVWVTERRLGIRLSQLAPIEHVGDLAPTPVLILTGTEDVHAPPDEAHALRERCGGPSELLLVPEAGHRDVFEKGGDLYQNRILDFLQRSLAA